MRSILSIALVSIGALVLPPAIAAQVQTASDTVRLPGVSQPVEIRRDTWGISHIYAQNERDLFFAQGFNAARDRLFQFEMWRRRATGTMAELIGPRALDHDIGARLLRFRGSLRDELSHYHPRGVEIVTAFVAGINAYIELTEANPDLLPLEFRILGTKPERWTPAIVISRHNGLFRNASREISMAKIVHSLGPAGAADLLDFQPETPVLTPDSTIDLALLTEAILRYYSASRSTISFDPADVLPAFRNNVGKDSTTTCRPPARCPARASPFELAERASAIGSNNWVVAGERTFGQYPMMANDPHRVLRVPSLRYWVHLVGPGWNVIGGGEPALPGVSIGHNEFGAWGLTIFETDQEDLYVYDTNPQNPRQYRYGGRWVDMEIERERIGVRDAPSVEVELRYTRHGPVLHHDSLRHKAYALRAAWLELGGAPYLASLRIDQATSWEEFRAACDYFRTPSENMVWADRAGNIGWHATGITPLRRGWDGMLPVPGDGRYEWDGFLRILDLPHLTNPPEGWIATANANNLPRGYRPIVGYEWSTPFRISRISEVLASGRRLTLMDMQQLQQDELTIAARVLVPLLAPLDLSAGAVRDAAHRLLDWDFVLDSDAPAAAIYAFWEARIIQNLWRRLVPDRARDAVRVGDLSLRRVVEWVTVPDGRFGPSPTIARDELLISSLQEAVTELTDLLGSDQARWRYGRLKHVYYEHALAPAVRPEIRDRLNVGPLPRGGYRYTVNNTSGDLNQSSGATFRIIIDTGNWDLAVGTNAPGQSGDPASPHYRDLFVSWATGRYFPILFSRKKVESATEQITILRGSEQ